MSDLLAQELCALAARLRRLRPERRDPEAFHMERGDIAYRLEALAAIYGGREPPPKADPVPETATEPYGEVRRPNGRLVRIERRKTLRRPFAISPGT